MREHSIGLNLKCFFVFSISLSSIEVHAQIEQTTALLESVRRLEDSGDLDSAVILAQTGIVHARKYNQIDSEIRFHIRYASILGKSQKINECIPIFKKALELALKERDTLLVGRCYLGLGTANHILNMLDSATYFYGLSLLNLRAINDQENLNGLMNNLALLSKKTGQYDKGMTFLHESLKSNIELKDSSAAIGNYRNLALMHSELSDYAEALEYFKLSNEIALKLNDQHQTILSISGIAGTYLLMGDSVKSMKYYQANDSIYLNAIHKDYNDKILELETKFRTTEIERDNALKQTRIETQEQRMIYLYIIAAFLGLSILAVYLYNEQRKKVIRALAMQREQENVQRIEDLLKQQELKSAYAMLAGQEKAHKRIAMELHDNLGSILVTLNMFADTLQKKTKPEDQKKLAQKISEVAQVANEATRKISHSLDSGVLKHFGLETAINELIGALNESETIAVSSHIQITEKLDSELSLNVYRIIQELINNTLKHAHASKITIDLNQIKDHLSLIYEDDGIGFEMTQDQPKGMGLKNLESRVDSMEGTLTIESMKDKGTTTIIEIPIT
ncbi:MAG: sensor histidine kinase [Marinoscillum sp.]